MLHDRKFCAVLFMKPNTYICKILRNTLSWCLLCFGSVDCIAAPVDLLPYSGSAPGLSFPSICIGLAAANTIQ